MADRFRPPHIRLSTSALAMLALIAFAVCERLGDAYITLHVWKADRSLTGAYTTLLHRTCLALAAGGHRLLNIGQDLGHPGMAQAKRALHPFRMLRKYALIAR